MNPATQQVKRAVRLMDMRDLLSQGYTTVAVLARRYGVTERTIYYDLQDLQLAPIEFPLETVQIWAARCLISQLCK